MDEAIIAYIRRHHNLLIGEATAERIKKEVGSAAPPPDGNGITIEIKGRDLLNGVPKRSPSRSARFRRAWRSRFRPSSRRSRWRSKPRPRTRRRYRRQGHRSHGRWFFIINLDQVLREETGLPVIIADEPLSCVALGTGKALEHFKQMRHILTTAY